MTQRPGLAIINMLIFVVIFSILSGIVLGLLSTNTRSLEKDVRRTKAFYATEAGAVYFLDRYRTGSSLPASLNIPWYYDPGTGLPTVTKPVNFATAVGGGPTGTSLVNVTCDYTLNW